MLKRTFCLAGALALSFASPANSTNIGGVSSKLIPFEQSTTLSPIAIGSRLSGKEKLKRVLRSHFPAYLITQDIRDATGDPNIVVFDRRSGRSGAFYCSYITYRKKRAMVCD